MTILYKNYYKKPYQIMINRLSEKPWNNGQNLTNMIKIRVFHSNSNNNKKIYFNDNNP